MSQLFPIRMAEVKRLVAKGEVLEARKILDGPMHYYWEEIKDEHVSEIRAWIYRCSMVVVEERDSYE